MFEERVEGSVTRLAAVFHSQDADPVGPIRSFRTTDLEIVSLLTHPLFAWSGANEAFAAEARSGPLIDVGYDAASDAYYRDGGRRAPHNLMSSTPALYAAHPGGCHPAAAHVHLPGRRARRSPAAARSPTCSVTYGGGGGSAPVNYQTDPATGRFLRLQKDTPHLDAGGVQVNVDNVVILFVQYVDTGVHRLGRQPRARRPSSPAVARLGAERRRDRRGIVEPGRRSKRPSPSPTPPARPSPSPPAGRGSPSRRDGGATVLACSRSR